MVCGVPTVAKPKTQIGAVIRQRRQAANLSRQALATVADCSLASIALFESGYSPETSTVLPRILAALDAIEAGAAPGREAPASSPSPIRELAEALDVAPYELQR